MPFLRTPPPKSLAACRDSDYYAETDEQLEKQIRHLSMDLIEVAQPAHTLPQRQSAKLKNSSFEGNSSTRDHSSIYARARSMDADIGESRIIQPIHISVRDFFLRNNGFTIFGPTPAIADGYISILRTCLDYITVSELDNLVAAREKTRPSQMLGRHSDALLSQDDGEGGSEYQQRIWESLSSSGNTAPERL
jgi:hypothetical protein